MVRLIVARCDRAVLDRQFVAVDAHQRPDFAGSCLPQPRLTAEEAVPTFEILRLALLRLVPGLAAIGRSPDEIWSTPAVVINTEQQRPVGQLQQVSRRVIAGVRFDLFRFDSPRFPCPAAVCRAMQEAGRVAPFVSNVLLQQVPGDKDCAVLEHRQIRLATQQIEFPGPRPGLAVVFRTEQQRLLHDLVAVPLVLMKRGQQQFAIRHFCNTRLVVVRFAERDSLAGNGTTDRPQRILNTHELRVGGKNLCGHDKSRQEGK